ncbi:MAG: PglD-related sugar-binding protein [Bacillota bacterium]
MKVLSGTSLRAGMETASPVLIIGAGGHGKEILEIFLIQKYPVLGFIDENSDLAGAKILDVPV